MRPASTTYRGTAIVEFRAAGFTHHHHGIEIELSETMPGLYRLAHPYSLKGSADAETVCIALPTGALWCGPIYWRASGGMTFHCAGPA